MKKSLLLVSVILIAILLSLFASAADTGFYLTEQVRRVVAGDTIQLNPVNATSTVSYSTNNNSVATVASNGKVTAVSSGTATITATSGGSTSTCKVIVIAQEIAPVEIARKSEQAPAENVIVSSLGDSITTYTPNASNRNYHDWWADWYYITNEDKGVSSSTIANYESQVPSFLDRYSSMRDDADIVTVKGGTNDWGQWSKITFGDIDSRSDTSFEGAVRLLMEGLIEKFPNKPIVFFTPIKRCNTGTGSQMLNGGGDYLLEYVDAVKALGEKYDIPVIDIFEPAELDFTSEKVSDGVYADERMPDGLHPNADGHEIMARYMMQEMVDAGIISLAGLLGDIDGDGVVTPIDYTILARYLADFAGYNSYDISSGTADLDSDGSVTTNDGPILARHLANWKGYSMLPFIG